MSNFKTVSLMQGNKFVDTYEAQESPRRTGDYIIQRVPSTENRTFHHWKAMIGS